MFSEFNGKNMRLLFAFLILGLLFSCKEKDNDNSDDEFNRSQMLGDYADNYIIPNYNALIEDLDELENSAVSIVNSDDVANIELTKNNFKTTYLSWQRVAFLNFGPAESNSLLNLSNIFPVNTTKIKDNIQSGNYNLLSASNTDAIGFPALDYLLFGEDEFLNAGRFDNDNLKKYLIDVISLIKSRTDKVLNEWNGNYKVSFKDNDGKSVGSGISMIVNSINKYWEKDLRDGKFGIPIGYRTGGQTLPDKLEAYYSYYSIELLKEGIKSYINFFKNNDNGLSLYDYLFERRNTYGDGKLYETIMNNFQLIHDRIENLDGSLSSNIENNNQELLSIYQDFQKQVVFLKVDMPSILGVSITYQDSDGD